MLKKIKYLLVACLLFTVACSDSDNNGGAVDTTLQLPQKEMRAVWMTTAWGNDWPQKATTIDDQKQLFLDYLEIFKKYNINTIFVHVRPMADALYPSTLSPWSQYITGTQGKDPGYDVMQFMIEETHKAGMEFHAWMNPYRITSGLKWFTPADDHIIKKHPEWGVKYYTAATATEEDLLILNPALPEVREHFIAVVDEVVSNYDVDGVHFDDYFYPYPVAGKVFPDAAEFAEYGKDFAEIGDFRRNNVNLLMEGVHNMIQSKKPSVKFSISPFAIWRNSSDDPLGSNTSSLANYDDLYADIRLWCEKGWVNFVVPQLYQGTNSSPTDFRKLVEWWPRNSFNAKVIVGYGIHQFKEEEAGKETQWGTTLELKNQFFHADLRKDISGGAFYSARDFQKNTIDILSVIGERYVDQAVIPYMGAVETKPAALVASVAGSTLSWNATAGNPRYVVYKIENNKARVMTITSDTSIELKDAASYAVTSLAADNLESEMSDPVSYGNK